MNEAIIVFLCGLSLVSLALWGVAELRYRRDIRELESHQCKCRNDWAQVLRDELDKMKGNDQC